MGFHSPKECKLKKDFAPLTPPVSITLESAEGYPFHFRIHKNPNPRAVLVFVHGSPGLWENFSHYFKFEALREAYTIIAVDRPGYGESNFGKSTPSLEAQSKIIGQVFDELPPEIPVILIGHSLGGPVVARMTIDFPEKVSGLLFLAASMDPELEVTKWYQYPAAWPVIRSIIPDALRVCNEEIFPHRDELLLLQSKVDQIRLPIVIIQGEKDKLVPAANVDYIVSHFSNASISVHRYPELNHFIPFSHPTIVIDAIDELDKMLTK